MDLNLIFLFKFFYSPVPLSRARPTANVFENILKYLKNRLLSASKRGAERCRLAWRRWLGQDGQEMAFSLSR